LYKDKKIRTDWTRNYVRLAKVFLNYKAIYQLASCLVNNVQSFLS
jgi:hypothetical protein